MRITICTQHLKMLSAYCRYAFYVLQHKWYVFIECLKIAQPLHGITHDFSKFFPSEFFPYARFFKSDKKEIYKTDFQFAWCLHQHRNKHHWDYWVMSDGMPVPMPWKNVMHMIADWRAMGRQFNDSAEQFYSKNKHKMVLHSKTIKRIEDQLAEIKDKNVSN